MENVKVYDKEYLSNFTIEELELLVEQEKAYYDNGITLLEAIMNVPFKSKEKFNQIKQRVSIHSQNILNIEERINELRMVKKPNVKDRFVKIKYIDNDEVKNIDVLDDIFQSVFGNFYMLTANGTIISMDNILDIDKNSLSGKWYEIHKMNIDFSKNGDIFNSDSN